MRSVQATGSGHTEFAKTLPMKSEFPNASNEFKRLNPHLFGVGAVVTSQHQPHPGRALEQNSQRQQGRKSGVVYRVTLVSYRRRLVDAHDNLRHGFKPLTDSIAASLNLDDADKRIQWEFGQVKSSGKSGVAVKIECSTT